ncbi:hypothetical protein BDV34DRAFT_185268 [Aspergillus parasiticus]|uniref:Zn(2)-C6 fungal-type domain-containing protein n=1 Tax=Aspergillus parasiticus TaxID=5067 RepID=A0A5N6E0W2_ASPPA|nr:hypothetical protein BDV34DRAFT_185268 [Aspergillus parasiticus]
MDQSLPGGRRPRRRSGPRSRKGCLTCRGRHTRCDEARPICSNCRKSRLQCQQPEFVSSKWNICNIAVARAGRRTEIPPEPNLDGQCTKGTSVCEPEPQRYGEHQVQEPQSASGAGADCEVVSPPAESLITPEIVHLLRVYERSIATWMDVFDSELTYQRRLLCMAPSSPLVLNAICALAARQLSLIGSSLTWLPVAEHYYGQAVHLLARLLNAYPSKMELAIVGTILLSSYELLAFPGLDYQRHFKGAHTIVDSIHAHKSASCLIRASFWIYARHEVAEALNRNSPTLHDPGSWPKFDLLEAEPAEDSFCNDVLRLTAETVCIVFGKTSRSRTKRRKRDLSTLQGELRSWLHICPEQWKGIEYTEDGNARYWFPRPSFGAALVFYHLSMLLLWHELEKAQEGPEDVNEMLDQVDAHSRQIILIALSSLPDSAIVVVVQPLCYAIKHIRDSTLKENAIIFLHDIEARTGFHTKSKLERQLCR